MQKDSDEYRPSQCEDMARPRKAVDDAVSALDGSPEKESALEKVRKNNCSHCRGVASKSMKALTSKIGMCRAYWMSIRDEACVDCGVTGIAEFDHIVPATKVEKLGSYVWWSNHGGVDAMRAEKAKCVPRCRMCHDMQPTHTKFQRKYATTAEMPTTTYRERECKRFREYSDVKYMHVVNKKKSIGACQECGLAFDETRPHLFHFAHLDASTKEHSISDLCRDRYCPATRIPVIDAECAKCRLLCASWHKEGTRTRNMVV